MTCCAACAGAASAGCCCSPVAHRRARRRGARGRGGAGRAAVPAWPCRRASWPRSSALPLLAAVGVCSSRRLAFAAAVAAARGARCRRAPCAARGGWSRGRSGACFGILLLSAAIAWAASSLLQLPFSLLGAAGRPGRRGAPTPQRVRSSRPRRRQPRQRPRLGRGRRRSARASCRCSTSTCGSAREGLDVALARAAAPPDRRRAWPAPLARRLPAEPPVDPGRDVAREWARRELSDPVYAKARPGLLQRLVEWLVERLQSIHVSRRCADPRTGVVAPGALVALVVGAWCCCAPGGCAGRRRRARPTACSPAARSTPRAPARPTQAAAAGRWADAVRERFRAVVRALEERVVLDERPGRTADEAAAEAGGRAPGAAGRSQRGAPALRRRLLRRPAGDRRARRPPAPPRRPACARARLELGVTGVRGSACARWRGAGARSWLVVVLAALGAASCSARPAGAGALDPDQPGPGRHRAPSPQRAARPGRRTCATCAASTTSRAAADAGADVTVVLARPDRLAPGRGGDLRELLAGRRRRSSWSARERPAERPRRPGRRRARSSAPAAVDPAAPPPRPARRRRRHGRLRLRDAAVAADGARRARRVLPRRRPADVLALARAGAAATVAARLAAPRSPTTASPTPATPRSRSAPSAATPTVVWWTPDPLDGAAEPASHRASTSLLPAGVRVRRRAAGSSSCSCWCCGAAAGWAGWSPSRCRWSSGRPRPSRAAAGSTGRAGARGRAAEALRAATVRRLAVRCGLPRTADVEQVVAAASARSPAGPPRRQRAAVGPRPADDAAPGEPRRATWTPSRERHSRP